MAIVSSIGLLPDVLQFSIGAGPEGPWHALRWSGTRIEYFAVEPGTPEDERTAVLFEPALAQWQTLWRALDELDVWSWQERYTRPGGGSLSWSFDLRRGGRLLSTSGAHAFPPRFDDLRRALRALVAGLPL